MSRGRVGHMLAGDTAPRPAHPPYPAACGWCVGDNRRFAAHSGVSDASFVGFAVMGVFELRPEAPISPARYFLSAKRAAEYERV